MKLRAATPADAQALAEVQVTAWQAAYRGLMPEAKLARFTVEHRLAGWQRALADPRGAATLVAEADGAIAGYCWFGPTRDEDGKGRPVGEIIALNIRPQQWRRGIGKALCEAALAQSTWKVMTLWVLKGNQRARRFYEALSQGYFFLSSAMRRVARSTKAPPGNWSI